MCSSDRSGRLDRVRTLPAKLIAFDQAESELFKLDLELRKNFPSLDLLIEVGDIRDLQRLRNLIGRESVSSLFHAAAYEHVPMMEAHVLEAVKNNIMGTWNVVRAASENRVSDFLMISSDKAVRPTNVMGVTKRIAELIVSATSPDGSNRGTKFVSVRFGNVLGSDGSVVPIFQAQIAAGGPITVTHPEVRRYFMTSAHHCGSATNRISAGRSNSPRCRIIYWGSPSHLSSSPVTAGWSIGRRS